ncbi:MAG: nucleotidyltransferase [Acidimicrobiales bacterium]|nr:nucleotidyltransferase [Acidimicrobiales bacterium]
MSRSDDHRLEDMREMCTRIAELVDRGRPAFDDDAAILPALERLLEILGEAANQVSQERRGEYPTIAWRDVTRLRVRLAHHYHRVEPEQVWAIATKDAPIVARALASPAEEHRR